MLILIAGPYRSGTNDDPYLMAQNLDRLESFALPIYRAGHIPMIGEWVALPVWNAAGGKAVGDDLYEEIFHPVAGRLLQAEQQGRSGLDRRREALRTDHLGGGLANGLAMRQRH